MDGIIAKPSISMTLMLMNHVAKAGSPIFNDFFFASMDLHVWLTQMELIDFTGEVIK